VEKPTIKAKRETGRGHETNTTKGGQHGKTRKTKKGELPPHTSCASHRSARKKKSEKELHGEKSPTKQKTRGVMNGFGGVPYEKGKGRKSVGLPARNAPQWKRRHTGMAERGHRRVGTPRVGKKLEVLPPKTGRKRRKGKRGKKKESRDSVRG